MLHIAHLVDRLSIGGAEKLLVTFAHAARNRQVKLTVISLYQDQHTPIPGELRALGVGVKMFPARKLLSPRRLYCLTQFLRHQRFDLIHTHLTYANIIGPIVGRLTHTPIISTLHSTAIDTRCYHSLRHKLESSLLRHGAKRIIAVGPQVAAAHRSRLKASIDIVPNAIMTTQALPPRERLALRAEIASDPSRPLLLSVGRLTEAKGFFDLIAALDIMRQTDPNFTLAIAGDGDLLEPLSDRIKTLGIEKQVKLLGIRHDVPRLLAASDLYVSASHWEGLPIAILEAMAAGLPIVATRVGDIPHAVIHGTGTLVSPHEPSALAAAIKAILDNPQQRQDCAAAAQAHVTQHYGAEAWIDRLLEIYAQIIDSTPLESDLEKALS